MKRGLVWLRNDLRVHDNPALTAACASCDQVVALWIATPQQWRVHDWGVPRQAWQVANVAALADDLAGHGIALRIAVVDDYAAQAAEVARQLVAQRCTALYINREYEWNERQRDAGLDVPVPVHCYDDQCALVPGTLRSGAGAPYRVFGAFRRRYLDTVALTAPSLLPQVRPTRIATQALPSALAKLVRSTPQLATWPAGSAEAQRRLAAFVDDGLSGYATARDVPALAATSALSPYLACGAISITTCLRAALTATQGSWQHPWIDELIWRDFYRHVLWDFPRVSRGRAFQVASERVAWRDAPDELAAWAAGRTGIPLVDAGMRQLASEGWIHNRVRMVVATVLAKHLLIDWRHGERVFMHGLVDADLASNNGGWQWSASTGTDAAPYFRVMNPWRQAARFDPDGIYINRYVPELAGVAPRALHDPARLAAVRPADYPAPIVDCRVARQRAIDAFRTL
ncbi:MAG: cryptochrome/photolyase family protein [Planctomycetota bacterium]|jgi:deoxyribodipyrimidine photo-lyase